MYQPAYQPPVHRPMSESMKGMFSNTILALGIGLGLVLLWIGALIWGFTDTTDGQNVGMLIRSLGVLVLTAVLLIGGVLRDDLEKSMRWALIVAGTIVLVVIGFWSMFWWVTFHF